MAKLRKVLILNGDGINSDNELQRCFYQAGAEVDNIHINNFFEKKKNLKKYDLLALPGGFSFGDEIKSGKVFAEKIRNIMFDEIQNFINLDKRILGICNGFQMLIQLGLLEKGARTMTLTHNQQKQFLNKWVELEIKNDNPWFQKLDENLFLPIRHGEGRLEIHPNLQDSDIQIVAKYKVDVNGSKFSTAAILSPNQNMLGIMPHPEVATEKFLHPFKNGAEDNARKVRQFFINAIS